MKDVPIGARGEAAETVSASDGTQEMGRGTVGRAVVSVSKFAARMRNRGESCVPSCEYRVASKRTNGQFMGREQSAELSLGEHSQICGG